jgi:hypothetical protein
LPIAELANLPETEEWTTPGDLGHC